MKTIVIIETGHITSKSISGGDLLMQGMIPFLRPYYHLVVILPTFARAVWRDQSKTQFFELPHFHLDQSVKPLAIFIAYCWRILLTIKQLLALKNIDIVYSSTNIFVDIFPAFIFSLIKKNINWCARVHHLIPAPGKRSGNIVINSISFSLDQLMLLALRRATVVITLNENIRQTLIARGFPSKKVFVVGGGIDYFKIRNWKPLKNTLHYDGVFVGRLHYTKGIMDLPLIWYYVTKTQKRATLAIIGSNLDITIIKQLQKKIRELHLQQKIKILGYMSETEKLSILKKASVFLFTDHEAGFGLSVAEAMASGLPIVGYDIGILGSVYTRGFKKVTPYHTREFADAVLGYMNLPRKRTIISTSQTEAKKFDWKLISNKLHKILMSI